MQDSYLFHHSDLFVEVSDEVAAVLAETERIERNYIRRVYWNKAHFSLDTGDDIEHEALFVAPSPCELYERKATAQELRATLDAFPDTRCRRVYARYTFGPNKTGIVQAEDVVKSRASESTERGFQNMEKLLRNTF